VALADAASFVIAAVLTALVVVPATAEPSPTPAATAPIGVLAGVWHDWRDGLRRIGSDRPLATVFGVDAVASIGEGFFSVLFVVFIAEVLQGGAPEVGWLVGAQAVGGVVGAALLGGVGRGRSPVALLGWGAIGLSTIDLLTINYPAVWPEAGIWPALVFMVVVGLPAVAYVTGLNTLLQTRTEDAYRGRVFGALQAVSALLMVAGAAAAGPLHGRFGVVPVLNAQAMAYIVAGIAALALLGAGGRALASTTATATAAGRDG
jgi:MFS family permease